MKLISIRVRLVVLGFMGLLLAGPAMDIGAQATHKPLLEFVSKTTCSYCKYAHQALRELDVERKDTFHYVSLVGDMSATAYARARTDYNFYGYPTVFGDGGYTVALGAGSGPSTKSTYLSNLAQCETRPVANLDLSLAVEWMGPARMDIQVSVKNNGSAAYAGRIRVYVTEIQSSLNWRDTAGYPYTYAVLDFAMNQTVSVGVGQKQDLGVQWDGGPKGFGSISHGNIKIIAAVFNGTGQTAYALPPNRNPFLAYHVDATAAARPGALGADTKVVSALGGAVKLGLYAGQPNAHRSYLLGGSLSGTTPGTPMPGNLATLPLNLDAFTVFVVTSANTPMFSQFLGALDSQGTAAATLNVPSLPAATGINLYFAYVLTDGFDFVSNPLTVEIR